MWIALGIVGGLAALITVILLLPVKIIIKNDENDPLILRYKFLFKTYGEDPDPNDPIIKALKTASGIDRLEKRVLQENDRVVGVVKAVKESYSMLADLLKELWNLLRFCRVTKLMIKIRCTGDGADQVAIRYGEYCTATYSLLNVLRGFMKVRKRGCKIDIGCDFEGETSLFRYDVLLKTNVSHVLAALWRTVMAETNRMQAQKNSQAK